MTMTESDLSKKIQELAVKFKCKLLRNNSGAMKDKTGRHVRYGLGNISKKLWDKWKTSDQIGYTKVVITPDMVGRTVAIFTAVEVKLPDSPIDDRYRAQEKFINQVKVDGGIAAIIKSIDEIEDLFNSYFTRS